MQKLNPEESEKIAELLKTIAHPLRVSILEMLEGEEKSHRELYEQLGCSQSVLSQQIRILRDRGLIECRKNGTSKYCTVHIGHLRQLINCARTCLFAKDEPAENLKEQKSETNNIKESGREYSSQPS